MADKDWRKGPRNTEVRGKGQLLTSRQRNFITGRMKRHHDGYDQVKQQVRRIYENEFSRIFAKFLEDSWLLNDRYANQYEKSNPKRDEIDNTVLVATIKFAKESRALFSEQLPVTKRQMEETSKIEGDFLPIQQILAESEAQYLMEVEKKFQRKRFRKAKEVLLLLEKVTLNHLKNGQSKMVTNQRQAAGKGESIEFSVNPRILNLLKQNGLIGGETEYEHELCISRRGVTIANRLRTIDRS